MLLTNMTNYLILLAPLLIIVRCTADVDTSYGSRAKDNPGSSNITSDVNSSNPQLSGASNDNKQLSGISNSNTPLSEVNNNNSSLTVVNNNSSQLPEANKIYTTLPGITTENPLFYNTSSNNNSLLSSPSGIKTIDPSLTADGVNHNPALAATENPIPTSITSEVNENESLDTISDMDIEMDPTVEAPPPSTDRVWWKMCWDIIWTSGKPVFIIVWHAFAVFGVLAALALFLKWCSVNKSAKYASSDTDSLLSDRRLSWRGRGGRGDERSYSFY